MMLFLLLACAGGDAPKDTGSGDTDADTDTDTDTDTDVSGTLIRPCGDQPFTVSCSAMSSGHYVCSDYFGAFTEALVRPQCEAGGGTVSTSPCVMADYGGTCVFQNPSAEEYCYMTHVPTGAAEFWSTACPSATGTWEPA